MKRIFALVLVLCVLAGLQAPVFALDFADAKQVTNLDTVTTLVDLGLFNGYADGTFQPKLKLRRSEAAKVLATVAKEGSVPASMLQFSDVPAEHWAHPYVAYCIKKGILTAENGLFRPNDCMTGEEFAAAVMRTLGRDGADAEKAGLFRDYTVEKSQYISRDGSCLILYNAMQTYAVVGKNIDGTPVYAVDELMNPQTYLEYRFHVVRFSGVLEANEYGNLAENGGRLEKGWSKLKSHAEFQISTPMEYLGRMVELYAVRSEVDGVAQYRVIGLPTLTETDGAFTVTSAEYFDEIVQKAGLKIQSSTEVYFNADLMQADFRDLLYEDYTITAVDYEQDLTLDKIMVTSYAPATVIAENPLQIRMGAQVHDAQLLHAAQETPSAGTAVRVIQMAGSYYISE